MTSVRCRADVLVALIASAVWAAEPPLTTARQVRDLPPDRAAGHLPVRLEATIFHVDRDTTVFLQDDTGATFLTTSKTPFTKGDPAWVPGARVRVEGTTYPGLYVGGVKPDRIDVIGTVPLPPPTRVTPDDLASGRWHYQWVEVEGIVLSTAAGAKPGTCVLRLGTGAGEVEVRVAADLPPGPSPVEARVAVRGLAAGAINDRRQLVRPFVAAQTFRDVAVLAPPDPDPFARPTVPVCKLMRYDPERAAGRRVKVAGVVTYHAPGTVLGLRDGDDAVSVESTQADPLEPGDVVEVLGFPRPGPFRAVLAHAAYRKVGTGPPPEVRAATPDEARKGVWDADLVRVEATVVEAYPGPDGDVVSLRAGDTRFPARCPPGAAADLRPGTVVAVTGICRTAATTEGGYSVRPAGFEV